MITEQDLLKQLKEDLFSLDNIKELPIVRPKHSIIEKTTLNCACCDKPLLDLIITQHRESHNQPIQPIRMYQAKCTCGNTSFVKKINGFANFAPINNLKIKKVITENNLTIIEVI